MLDKGRPCLAALLEAGEAARQVGTAVCLGSSCFPWVVKLQKERPDHRSRTVLAALAQYGLFSDGNRRHLPRKLGPATGQSARHSTWKRGSQAHTPARICARSAGKSATRPDSSRAARACSLSNGALLFMYTDCVI